MRKSFRLMRDSLVMRKVSRSCTVFCLLSYSTTVISGTQHLSCRGEYEDTVYALNLSITDGKVVGFDYHSDGPDPGADCNLTSAPSMPSNGFNGRWSAINGGEIVDITRSDGTNTSDYSSVRITNQKDRYELHVNMAKGQTACSVAGFLPAHVAIYAKRKDCVTLKN